MSDPIPTPQDDKRAPGVRTPTDTELLSTLFELGREVTSVLDLEELLAKIPQLIARLTRFSAFSVYLLDEKRKELRIAYAVGYPGGASPNMRLSVGQGVVGAAVEEGRPILVNDIRREPRYRGPLRNMLSQLAVPLRRKGKVIGALNLLNEVEGAFTSQDEALLRQFAAHVAVAIENARLFESERLHIDTLEALAEIGREMSSILDLDALLTRIANLTKRLVDYRTFGILLLNDATQELEMKLAVRYGKDATVKNLKLGEGLVGWAAQHREPVLVADVSQDPRYINLVEDARSELVVPMLIKDRCIGVFDLESPELDAFTKEHKELMTLLASQAAVAIENARLYEQVRRNEERIEKELRFAQRVQAALLPTELPDAPARRRRRRALCVGARARRRHPRLPRARGQHARRRRRRRVGQGRAGGALRRVCRRAGALADDAPPLYAGSLQRVGRAAGDEHHPARAAARGVLLHALLRVLRLPAQDADAVELRAAVPDPLLGRGVRADRAPGRAARFVSRRHLRREVDRSPPRTTSSCSAPTASSRRSTTRATSSARGASATSCATTEPAPRARSWTPSSTRSTRSAAASRRTTT